MTDKEELYALMAVAEEQQQAIDKAIGKLNNLQAHMPVIIEQGIKHALDGSKNAIESDLNAHGIKVATDIKKASNDAQKASESIIDASKLLGWKYIALLVGILSTIALAVFMVIVFNLPSWQDIETRQKLVEKLNSAGGNLDLSKCDGKLCVRVMKKQCNYGKHGDFCVLDLKD